MTGPQIDYAAVYRQSPLPALLLTPEFVIADMNQACLRTRAARGGNCWAATFSMHSPKIRRIPGPTGVRNSIASLRRVLATGEPDSVEFQKYDVEVPGSPGQFARYYWSGVNAPVLGPDGHVGLIAIMAEDVTDRMHRFMSALQSDEMYEGTG